MSKTAPKPPINDNDQNNNKLLLDAIYPKFKESFNFHFFDNNLFIQPKNETGKKNVIKIDIKNINAENICLEISTAIKKTNKQLDKDKCLDKKITIYQQNAKELEKLLGKTSLAEIDKKVYSQTIVDKWKKLIEAKKPKSDGENIQK